MVLEISSELTREEFVIEDAEGNRFSPIDSGEYGVTQEGYVPESSYAGEIVDTEEASEHDGAIQAVVLWPTN
jgi:hypothetical protein